MSNAHKESKPVALVTGAAGAIGRCVARRLAEAGHALVLVDVDEAGLSQVEPGSVVHRACCDLSRPAEVSALVAEVARRFPELRVLVNNAGCITPGPFLELSPEALDRQLDVNLRAAMHLTLGLGRLMAERGAGHLVSVVSLGGVLPLKGGAAYSASKFGLRGFNAALFLELRERGVHVSGVFPSAIDTGMLRAEAQRGGSLLNFLGAPGQPDDVARAVLRVLSTHELEVDVPWSAGLFARWAARHLGWLGRLHPWLERWGERGRRRYLSARGVPFLTEPAVPQGARAANQPGGGDERV